MGDVFLSYDSKTHEYTMKIECGTKVPLLQYIGYRKNSSAKDVRLDRMKGKKAFSVDDTQIATVSSKGILTAVKEGDTLVRVTYMEVNFGFKLVVVEVKESREKGVVKLKNSVAKFSKGIKSKKSITQKNREKN